MKKTIDDIFKNSEHEKELELRPELWEKMERTLSNDPAHTPSTTAPVSKRLITPIYKKLMIAASLAFIFASAYALSITFNEYQVEDLVPSHVSSFTKEEIVSIDEQLSIKRTIIANLSLIST